MTDLGELHYFLGIEATQNSSGILLSQTKYTLDLLSGTGMKECKPATTPTTVGSKVSTIQGQLLDDPHEYRQIIGALQYLTMTRLDISYAVNQVCQYLQAPRTDHLVAVKHILCYLKHTVGAGTLLKPGPLQLIVAYTDADWADCPDTRRSTTGFCTYLGPNLISWGSRKQPTVSRSSSEAEYKALAVIVSEMLWLSYLLNDLRITATYPVVICCDNISATQMAANPVLHARTKHIELDYHFVRDLVISNKVTVQFVRSASQIADIFTKSLSSAVVKIDVKEIL
ncbi:uncharacterized mitochondrial protein AtMg00810-like [Telopea speciosissima]|uniref:uncharacterized mitochondrial protein AtMg00810-like n=1 Tax=Telopea speciosissima TaxID=54955 RepID=UPI001CC3A719|nr:uncharacterized mitochondrial protein AtMg00810-like [Telopea speciosissima]